MKNRPTKVSKEEFLRDAKIEGLVNVEEIYEDYEASWKEEFGHWFDTQILDKETGEPFSIYLFNISKTA